MAAPLIGLTGRRILTDDVPAMPPALDGMGLDVYFSVYAAGVIEAGGVPVHLALDADPDAVADHLDGLVLSGGADLDPAMYGQQPTADLLGPEPERDTYEAAILAVARQRSLPVLAICRGLQLVNVAAGGSLVQDVPPHSRFDVAPATLVHDIDIVEGSTLNRIYGPTRQVNSLHHQAVDRVGRGYCVTARSPDGTVEGLESDDGTVVAVQWHPEMMVGRDRDPLFGWLIDAAGAHRARQAAMAP